VTVVAPRLAAWVVEGIPEIGAGDNLGAIIGDALAAAGGLVDGDIVVVTSKVISKAEGRFVCAAERENAITAETVRVVATRKASTGVTRIVENRLGIVAAAAGVDASNTPDGTVLLLPVDPDASARALRASWSSRFGATVGVIVSDTVGRPWRQGQTDIAVGAAGVRVLDDLRGSTDAQGRRLDVTVTAVADEIAGLADLVKGKSAGLPVAVVRGLERFVVTQSAAGARALVRTGVTDMFSLGTAEAIACGYERAQSEMRGLRARAPASTPHDRSRLRSDSRGEAQWIVVIPFKGAPHAKSRLGAHEGAGGRPGPHPVDASGFLTAEERRRLAVAFLDDTVAAVAELSMVERTVIVSNSSDIASLKRRRGITCVADPGHGLNAAIAAAATAARAITPSAWLAIVMGDLAELIADDLERALDAGRRYPRALVADAAGTGTTMITAAPGKSVQPCFGIASRAAHEKAGHVALSLPGDSTLRFDVDTMTSVRDAEQRTPGLGPASRAALPDDFYRALYNG